MEKFIEELFQRPLDAKATRREVVVALAKAAFLGLGVGAIYPLYVTWSNAEAIVTGTVDGLDKIVSEVPGSLKNVEIPKANEEFRDADSVFAAGIDLYNIWRERDGSLPEPRYIKPSNYIDFPKALSAYMERAKQSPPTLINLIDIVTGGHAIAASYQFNTPYESFLASSATPIDGIESIILNDPGTGLVANIRKLFASHHNGEDVWDTCKLEKLEAADKDLIEKSAQRWFYDALRFIKDLKFQEGRPISSSILFAYFLFANRGDIVRSTWDVVTWLKIAARNDLQTFKFAPSYQKASFLTNLMLDEFSPHISANWIVSHVEERDATLNYLGDNFHHAAFKDYMPANRAGGYYHAWNIMALSLCMSPSLAKRMTANQLDPFSEFSWHPETEYGREKTTADMLVVGRLNQIAKIADKYLVEEVEKGEH